MRLPRIKDFDLCEPILFKVNEKTDSSCYLHNQEGLEHSFHTARKLDTDYSSERQPNCKTRRGQCGNRTSSGGEHETISQTKPQIQKLDVRPSHQDEAFVATSAAEHQEPEPTEPSRTSTRKRKQPDRFGEPIPTNLPKKRGMM